MILGDQVYQDDLAPYVEAFRSRPAGARILLKQVEDARRFGVATIAGDRVTAHRGEAGRAGRPTWPSPAATCTTAGCSTSSPALEPSARGELEITDVNNAYIAAGEMAFDVLPGWWADAGTHASKLKASILVALTRGVTFHA